MNVLKEVITPRRGIRQHRPCKYCDNQCKEYYDKLGGFRGYNTTCGSVECLLRTKETLRAVNKSPEHKAKITQGKLRQGPIKGSLPFHLRPVKVIGIKYLSLRISSDEAVQLIETYLNGASIRSLAEQYGYNRSSITTFLVEMGVK
jgi:hypothetical protein